MGQINQGFWVKETATTFKNFFNSKNAGRGHWGVNAAGGQANITAASDADNKLAIIFTPDNIKAVTGKEDINIYQFLIMTSIMLNETGGSFKLSTGEYGSCKYMFEYNPKIPKVSYNCGGSSPCSSLGNKTAYQLFRDPVFMNVPARANMYKPKNINDINWDGYTYPDNEPIGSNKAGNGGKENYPICGLISECDFFKFRGRGVIQLTGRGNYSKLFEYIKTNKASISALPASMAIINGWGNDNVDTIATKITNVEIDTLFSDNAIAILVFKTHSSNKALTEMYNVSSANKFIDLAYAYGKSIGGKKYGTLFTNRVFEIIENIPDWVTSQSTK